MPIFIRHNRNMQCISGIYKSMYTHMQVYLVVHLIRKLKMVLKKERDKKYIIVIKYSWRSHIEFGYLEGAPCALFHNVLNFNQQSIKV